MSGDYSSLSPQSQLPVILRYSAYRLAAWVAISLVLGFLFFMRHAAQVAAGHSGLFWLIMMVVMGIGALAFSVKLLARDDTAVAADDTHIELVSMRKRRLLRWDEVRRVRLMVRTIRIYGVIPIGRRRTLRIEREGRWLGKNIDLPLLTVTRDDDALQWLIDTHRARLPGVASRPRDPSARAHRLSDVLPPPRIETAPMATPEPAQAMAQSDAEFCPDAALNRYLARREATQSQPVTNIAPIARAPVGAMQGKRASFGRKML